MNALFYLNSTNSRWQTTYTASFEELGIDTNVHTKDEIREICNNFYADVFLQEIVETSMIEKGYEDGEALYELYIDPLWEYYFETISESDLYITPETTQEERDEAFRKYALDVLNQLDGGWFLKKSE